MNPSNSIHFCAGHNPQGEPNKLDTGLRRYDGRKFLKPMRSIKVRLSESPTFRRKLRQWI